jgi:3-phosphoshikimate 1-carboxyvinyltransferase
MTTPKSLLLQGLTQCSGEVTLPGSKSIANRALLMAALVASGSTALTNMLRSDDTERMLEALRALGVTIEMDPSQPTSMRVHGCGGVWPSAPQQLQLGNAGTALRPLTAVLSATLTEPVLVTGDQRMQQRPIAALVDSLVAAGAQIDYVGQPGYPPLRLGGGLAAGQVSIDGSASSQYVSALLMALPLLAQDSLLKLTGTVVSWPYIELTLAMLQRFGIQVHRVCEQEFLIPGGQRYQSPGQYWVEGDASAASYWLAAAAIGGGPLRVHGVGRASIQGDVAFANYLATMGAEVDIAEQWIDIQGAPLKALDADLNAIPDAAMTFATLALFARGTTHIRNVANWRIKESDRLHAMATELRKLGAEVVERADSLQITPPQQLQHAYIETYDDHRIAMSFALLGFSATGVTIIDPDCCRKTYPDFFQVFQQRCR